MNNLLAFLVILSLQLKLLDILIVATFYFIGCIVSLITYRILFNDEDNSIDIYLRSIANIHVKQPIIGILNIDVPVAAYRPSPRLPQHASPFDLIAAYFDHLPAVPALSTNSNVPATSLIPAASPLPTTTPPALNNRFIVDLADVDDVGMSTTGLQYGNLFYASAGNLPRGLGLSGMDLQSQAIESVSVHFASGI